jgi:hypothetical protein
MVVGFTNATDGKLFVYQYYWTKNDKLQSAWHRWEIGDARIMGAFFYDNILHLTVRRGNTHVLREDAVLAPPGRR